MAEAKQERRQTWRTAGGLALVVALLFALGFGAGRLINAMRSGALLTAPAEANATSAPAPEVSGLSWRQLERGTWRESAALLQFDDSIAARARAGDPRAQALACLAHMAGVDGVLPSPVAAREFCDDSAAQHEPAGLYLSWALHRHAPHAGLDEVTARGRLAEAARLGWSAAQVDYATTLSDQAEAGRLLLAAAEAGDARGLYQYARWLRDSPAGPRDPAQAIPFLRRASEANNADALHMLATLTRDGIGVAANIEEARRLYERAATQNHAPAMFNLADLVRASDRERAVTLYRQLACMRDERQIAPLAARRLRALGETVSCA